MNRDPQGPIEIEMDATIYICISILEQNKRRKKKLVAFKSCLNFVQKE